MAEDSDFEKTADGDLASQLKHSDVRAGMFEGGSKTWECSLDLAGVVVGDYEFLMTEDVEEVRIIEVCNAQIITIPSIFLDFIMLIPTKFQHGSGPAIPALALLKTIFRTPKPSHPPRRKTHFVLSDYNLIFLRLLTVPNVLLTWYVTRHHPDADADTDPESESELDITEPLLADFRADLEAYGLSFTFISGPWSQTWTDMAFPVPKEEGEKQQQQPVVGKGYTLLFSSETIYETRTYPEFVGSIVTILDRAAERHHHGIGGSSPDVRYKHPKALVAAKKMYFGVGGGIDDFVPFLNGVAGDRTSVGERLDVSDQGVSRGVWEVELTGRRND